MTANTAKNPQLVSGATPRWIKHKAVRLLIVTSFLFTATAQAQYTNAFTIRPAAVNDVPVYHKSSSAALWECTVSGVNLTNYLPITCGVKAAKGDTQFFALSTGAVSSTESDVVTFEFPASSWVTNITKTATMYGDVRMTGYDLALPSLNVQLKVGYNTGSETYIAPQNWNIETNGVSVGDIRELNFTDDLDMSVSADKLTVGMTKYTDAEAVSAGIAAGFVTSSVPVVVDGGLLTSTIANGTNTIGLTTGAVNNAESDPVWTAASNNYSLTTAIDAANTAQDVITAAHTNLSLSSGAHGGELDPIWSAVSNSVTTSYVAKSGDTMTGDLTMDDGTTESPGVIFENGTGEGSIILDSDGVLRIGSYDGVFIGGAPTSTNSMQGIWDIRDYPLINLLAGTNDTDAVNKGQMDAAIAAGGGGGGGYADLLAQFDGSWRKGSAGLEWASYAVDSAQTTFTVFDDTIDEVTAYERVSVGPSPSTNFTAVSRWWVDTTDGTVVETYTLDGTTHTFTNTVTGNTAGTSQLFTNTWNQVVEGRVPLRWGQNGSDGTAVGDIFGTPERLEVRQE
ncbi:MAG: hypothetical protein GY833_23925 [Aestuariibacter sp.]|nr:hypothetical protein [Aestuariibacter sp.]